MSLEAKTMEDIEDLLVGSSGGAPPGFRLPLTAVGLNPKKKIRKNKPLLDYVNNNNGLASKIPGTQVSLFLPLFSYQSPLFFFLLKCYFFSADNLYQNLRMLTQPGNLLSLYMPHVCVYMCKYI